MRRLVAFAIASTACVTEAPLPPPALEALVPSTWEEGAAPEVVEIRGRRLYLEVLSSAARGAVARGLPEVRLGTVALTEVTHLDNQTLTARGLDLPPGTYDLTVSTAGGSATLEGALRVSPARTQVVRQSAAGEQTLGGDDRLTTVPITPVDPARSLLFFTYTHSSDEPGTGRLTARLTDDGAAVELERNTTWLHGTTDPAGEEVLVAWTVLELDGVRVQRGREVFGDPTTVLVDLAQAVQPERALVLTDLHIDGTYFSTNDWLQARLVAGGAQLELRITQYAPGLVVVWQVAEWSRTSGAAVQHGDAALRAAATELSLPLAQPAALDRSALLFTQVILDQREPPDAASHLVCGRLSSPTAVAIERDLGWSQVDIDLAWSVLTWDALRVQHGTTELATDQLEALVPLPAPVDPTRAVALLAGEQKQCRSAWGADDHVGVAWFALTFADGGATLRLRRGFAGEYATAHWQVLELR